MKLISLILAFVFAIGAQAETQEKKPVKTAEQIINQLTEQATANNIKFDAITDLTLSFVIIKNPRYVSPNGNSYYILDNGDVCLNITGQIAYSVTSTSINALKVNSYVAMIGDGGGHELLLSVADLRTKPGDKDLRPRDKYIVRANCNL